MLPPPFSKSDSPEYSHWSGIREAFPLHRDPHPPGIEVSCFQAVWWRLELWKLSIIEFFSHMREVQMWIKIFKTWYYIPVRKLGVNRSSLCSWRSFWYPTYSAFLISKKSWGDWSMTNKSSWVCTRGASSLWEKDEDEAVSPSYANEKR